MGTKSQTPKSEAGLKRPGAKYAGDATGWVTFLVGSVIVAYLFGTNPTWSTYESYKFVNTGLCLWVPLMVIMLGLKQEPSQFGLTRGDRRLGLKWALLFWMGMLLLVAYASSRPDFRHYYLMGNLHTWLSDFGYVWDGTHVNLKALVAYELGMGFYMFCWEFFFRGFLLFGLQKTFLGPWGAVIVQALPFMLLHWSWDSSASKPPLEVFGSLIAGLVLGVLAIKTRSFLYGFIAHWAVSATFDLSFLAPFIFRHIG